MTPEQIEQISERYADLDEEQFRAVTFMTFGGLRETVRLKPTARATEYFRILEGHLKTLEAAVAATDSK